jgi:hypothetical protein
VYDSAIYPAEVLAIARTDGARDAIRQKCRLSPVSRYRAYNLIIAHVGKQSCEGGQEQKVKAVIEQHQVRSGIV